MKERKSLNENPCGKNQCGLCGIPNPINTKTKGEAQLGFAIIFSPSFQKGIQNIFGDEQAKKKVFCEYKRVKNILIKEYGVNVKKPFEWKL